MLKSRLKIVLAEQNMKSKELANIMGVSAVVVSNWVNSKSHPTTSMLFELAHKLNVKVDDLYEYIPE